MSDFPTQAFDPGPGHDLLLSLTDVARDYWDDPDFRARLEADPRAELEARNVSVEPADAEVRLRVNTPDVFHLVMAGDPNVAVSDQHLFGVSGGTSSASSVSTVGSAVTAGTVPSTASSASSVSSVGSAGSAGGS